MSDAVRNLVARYLSGEHTYPQTLASLSEFIDRKEASDLLRRAVEDGLD